MVAPILIKQTELAITSADSYPHATTGSESRRTGAKDFRIRLRAVLVAPKRCLITYNREQRAATDRAIATRMHADHDPALEPDLLGGDALNLLPEDG